MYNSGRCSGPRRYVHSVSAAYADIVSRARLIRENNFVDPERPQDGQVFSEDMLEDCAEPTLEEFLCEEGMGPCEVVGIRTNCHD